jgi:hypothetical protein
MNTGYREERLQLIALCSDDGRSCGCRGRVCDAWGFLVRLPCDARGDDGRSCGGCVLFAEIVNTATAPKVSFRILFLLNDSQ